MQFPATSSTSVRSQRVEGAAVLLTLVGTGVLLWLTGVPLGIPGEWTWPRLTPAADAPWLVMVLVAVAVAYWAVVGVGHWRLAQLGHAPEQPRNAESGAAASSRAHRWEVIGWLCLLTIAATGWLWMVQETAPAQQRLAKGPFVLFYPQSSGYFTLVRNERLSTQEFLAGYNERMQQGDVLHVGTHPPGLFLVFQGLVAAVQTCPALAQINSLQPTSVRDAVEIIRENTARSRTTRPLTPGDETVLWLATLGGLIIAASGVWPLYRLLEPTFSQPTAWVAAALWPTVPALAVFLPKSDALYPTLMLWIVVCWRAALCRDAVWLAALTSLLVWVGLVMSLAFLPVVLLLVMITLVEGGKRHLICQTPVAATTPSSAASVAQVPGCHTCHLFAALSVLTASCTFVLLTLVFGWLTGCELFGVWQQNYQNHAAFYAQSPRSYFGWLLVNPLELALACGAPLAVWAMVGLISGIGQVRHVRDVRFPLSCAAVLLLLWLSGKNSGEAARLWLPFIPWLIVLAATYQPFTGSERPSAEEMGVVRLQRLDRKNQLHPSRSALPMWLVAAQLVSCVITVHRVGGFHFVWSQ